MNPVHEHPNRRSSLALPNNPGQTQLSLRRLFIFGLTMQLLALFFLATAISPHVQWKEPPSFKDRANACETIKEHLFREQWNTMSNIAFVFVGEYVFCVYLWDRSAPTRSATVQPNSSNVMRAYPI